MKVSFLGTGGGRFAAMTQLRATGGWVLELDGEKISVDPGPSAIAKAKEFGFSLSGMSGLVISHAHLDHYTDAEVMIEIMTRGAKQKKGILVSNEHVIKGGNGYIQRITPYHLKNLERYDILKPGKLSSIGDIEITATRAEHTEPKTLGFVFSGSEKLGYISDTQYFEGIEKQFKGCDYLILNCIRPRSATWPKHLNTYGARKIIEFVGPKSALLTHFGTYMIKARPEKEAKWLEENTGVKTIAARDGLVFNLGKQ